MKKHLALIVSTVGCFLTALQGQNFVSLVSNGDFETVTGSTPYTFAELVDWSNLGTSASGAAQAANTMSGSIIGLSDNTYDRDGESFGLRAHVQNTGYTIVAGDSFDVSYTWRPSSAAAGWGTSDEIRFILYATNDDTALGTQVWSEIFDSGTQTVLNANYIVNGTSSAVTSGAVGQNLFASFYGLRKTGSIPTQPSERGFAGVDEISVSVVPELSTAPLLLGLTAMLLVLRRHL